MKPADVPEAPEDWYRDFFEGLAAELWRNAWPAERTAQEAALIADALDVDPVDRLLDLACGEGRLALPLASVGYEIVGVDLSQSALERARAAAAAEGLALELWAQDLRELPWPERFHGAFCVGNSLGYQDTAATTEMLRAATACLKPGRRLLLHSANLAETLLPFLEEQVRLRRGGIEMRATNRYDPQRRLLTTHYRFRKGQQVENRLAAHHVFTVGKVEAMMRASGLKPLARWATPDGEAFEGEAEEVWLLAEKAA